MEYLADQTDPLNFFVQEFVTGPDLSCSVLSQDGEIFAYTIQRVIVPSHKPFAPSAAVEFIHDEAVLGSIEKLIRAVKWSGVVCFDLVFDEETREAKVLEANPRYWRSLLASLSAGVNFPHLACLASQGLKVSCPEYRHVRYAKPEIAVGHLLRSWTGTSSPISRLSETGLPYVLRDPFPEVAIQLYRTSKGVPSGPKQ
jgi:predicted ATP-grasp superfamily ATP-dependent carboligase